MEKNKCKLCFGKLRVEQSIKRQVCAECFQYFDETYKLYVERKKKEWGATNARN